MTPISHPKPASSTRVLAAALVGTAVFSSLLFVPNSFAQESKPLAKIGDLTITSADLDQAEVEMAQQFKNFPAAERRARALDSLIDINVLSMLAKKEGLADDVTMKRRLALLTARVLHNGYFQKTIQTKVTEADVKARFDKEVATTKPEQEVSARHILVKTEEEAKAIIKDLEGGASFVEQAKLKSTGPSGPKGGDLGFFGKGQMVPSFEAAAFALNKGEFTKQPVKSQFGFHIIKVDDKRDKPLPSFDQAKGQIRQLLLSEVYASVVKEARASLGIKVLDESLKLPEVK